MRNLFIFLTACVLAAGIPFLPKPLDFPTVEIPFPGWPSHFEGKSLKKLQLSEAEKRFYRNFPGHIAKFTDGKQVLIIRWVNRETRKLHSVKECFKSFGYQVRILPLWMDNEGKRWGSLEAIKNGKEALIHERIFDNDGKNFSDVSAWYWAARLGKTIAPWWAITIVKFRDFPSN